MTARFHFERGHLYRLRTLSPPQKLQREHLLTYLWADRNGNLEFNARPHFGTQSFNPSDIVSAEDLGYFPSCDNVAHYVNKVVR